MERTPPLIHQANKKSVVVFVSAVTLTLIASVLSVAPVAATEIPSGDIFPSVFDPLDSTWKNGQPKGYSEGQVAVFETELRAGASSADDTWDVAICLDYFTGDTHFFTDFRIWNFSYSPEMLADGTPIAGLDETTDGFITFLYPDDGSTLSIVSVSDIYVQGSTSADEAICVDVSYTYDGTEDVHLLTGGYIAQTGDVATYTQREPVDTDPAVVLPTGGTVVNGASTTNGTFKVRLSGTADKTINFKGTDFAADPPSLTLIKEIDNTGGGVDDATEWLLTATASGEPAPALSGYTDDNDTSDPALGVTGPVLAGTYTLGETADPGVDGDYVESWDCGATTVNELNEIEVAAGEDVTCTVNNTYAALRVSKSVVTDPAPVAGYDVGDDILYRITVTNPTNALLTEVGVSDPLLADLDCDPGAEGAQTTGFSLQPTDGAPGGDDELVCTGSYTVQQSDIDDNGDDSAAGPDGDIDNTATADSAETGEADDSAEAPLDRNAGVDIVKDGSSNVVDGQPNRIVTGDGAEFEITVTNDGNVTLTDVVIDDAFATDCDRSWADIMSLDNNDVPAVPVGAGLDPTESFTYTCTATADEVSANAVDDVFTNTADVDAQPAGGGLVEDSGAAEVTILAPALSLSKSAAVTDGDGADTDPLDTATEAGDLVEYTVTATNTGEVVLTGVSVVDAKVSLTCDWPGEAGVLAVDDDAGTADVVEDEVVCTGVYTVQQDDLNDNGDDSADGPDGDIDNTASATSDQGVGDNASAAVPIQRTASIDIAKYHALNPDGSEDDTQVLVAGSTALWTIVVTNDGNVSLTEVVVADPRAPYCTIGWADVQNKRNADDVDVGDALEPGESFAYPCMLEDVDEAFTNTATATATQDPTGDSDTSDVDVIDPDIELTKTAPADIVVDSDTEGADVVFALTIANTGDVDLVDVALTDTGAVVDCDPDTDGDQPIPTTLVADDGAPGGDDEVECTATVDATPNPDGTWLSVYNAASVTGTADATVDAGERGVRDDDDATAHVVGVTVDKTVVELDAAGDPIGDPVEVSTVLSGSDIRWVVDVVNIGSKAVEFDLTDPLASGCERVDIALAAGAGTTVTCDVIGITDDVDPNTATVSATPAGAQEPLADVADSASVDVISPSIEIVKSVDGPIVVTGDDQSIDVTYTITVRNTGDVELTGVTVDDPGADVDCGGGDGTVGTLAADDGADGGADEADCTASITVTPDGSGIWSAVDNTATVCAESPLGDPANDADDVCDDDSATADFAGVTVEKQVGPSAEGPWSDSYDAAVGDTVHWQVTVTNIGSVDLIDVEVTDPHNIGCEVVIGTLGAGETHSVSCSEIAQYSDIGVTNTAAATGCAEVDPTGACVADVSDEDSAVYSALYNGFTPGFWKNHARGKKNLFDGDLMCGDGVLIDTDTTFGDVFGAAVDGITIQLWDGKGKHAGVVDRDLAEVTVYDALSFQGGDEYAGAVEILLRAAAASTLNTCFHLTLGNEIGDVDDIWPTTLEALGEDLVAALASGDRDTVLKLAATYDGWNNGLHDIDWSDW